MTARLEITPGLEFAAGVACCHGPPDPSLGARGIVPGPGFRFAAVLAGTVVVMIIMIAVPRAGALFRLGCGLGHEAGSARADCKQERSRETSDLCVLPG